MKVLNMRSTQFDPNTMVYIGRGPGKCDMLNTPVGSKGWLGNPVIIGQLCLICGGVHHDNGSTIPCYKSALKERLQDEEFRRAIKEVAFSGKDLVCWCAPKPCHGVVLAVIMELIRQKFPR